MRHRFRSLRPLLAGSAVLLAATLVACGGDDATAPEASTAGTYVLSGADGSSLPIDIRRFSFGGALQLSGATLALTGDGVARDVRRFREVTAGGTVVREFTDSSETTWRVAAGQVLIERPFPVSNPVAARLRVDTGRVEGGPLRLRVLYPFSNDQQTVLDTTLLYVRATAD